MAKPMAPYRDKQTTVNTYRGQSENGDRKSCAEKLPPSLRFERIELCLILPEYKYTALGKIAIRITFSHVFLLETYLSV